VTPGRPTGQRRGKTITPPGHQGEVNARQQADAIQAGKARARGPLRPGVLITHVIAPTWMLTEGEPPPDLSPQRTYSSVVGRQAALRCLM
jgi:hypothetical protein